MKVKKNGAGGGLLGLFSEGEDYRRVSGIYRDVGWRHLAGQSGEDE
jgi:hypothetical protein